MKAVRAFNYGKTIHDQPLTPQGRDNWDRIFGKEKEKEEGKEEKK